LHKIIAKLKQSKMEYQNVPKRKKRIAVILPVGYLGGSLRGAKLLAEAIFIGSKQSGQEVEVVLGHVDNPDLYSEDEFTDLSPEIKHRAFRWVILSGREAFRAMIYSGLKAFSDKELYQIFDDGVQNFTDCDLWVIVSDRLEYPLLPIRPYVLMVYDYLQRYVNFLEPESNLRFLGNAHRAKSIFVTTEFTKQDAIQFAGLPANKVIKVPMLVPVFIPSNLGQDSQDKQPYFLWTTNLATHKNHLHAIKALQIYYEDLGGKLLCYISGVGTSDLFKADFSHLNQVQNIFATSKSLKSKIKLLGNLSSKQYREKLAGSKFVWHPAQIDNGTFSVIEAAFFGVASLSSDYPAMREIDAQFQLNLLWMNYSNPEDMALKLLIMERSANERRLLLPSVEFLQTQSSVANFALDYWYAIEKVL